MNFSGKNILLISPEPWDHIFVSKHHYATHLAKRGNLVFFLGPPLGQHSIEKTQFRNVYNVGYGGFPRGLRFYPPFLQRYIIRMHYSRIQNLCGVLFDVVWSFDNSVFFDFSAIPANVLKISHIVDLNQNFQTAKAASTADYCVCTTELIKKRLTRYNSRVFKISHGYNHLVGCDTVMLPGRSKVKTLYAGNLAIPYIDWILLYQVVVENPEVDFIFVGPNADLFINDAEQNHAKKSIAFCDNAFFVGKLESNELIRYEVSADILLVAYQEEYHDNQAANSHKIMEYLGSGNLIIATYTSELVHYAKAGLFPMSYRNHEFPALFKSTLAALDYWNSKEMMKRREIIALDNTYDRQIDRIELILSRHENDTENPSQTVPS